MDYNHPARRTFLSSYLDSPVIDVPIALYTAAVNSGTWGHQSSKTERRIRNWILFSRNNIPSYKSYVRVMPEKYPNWYSRPLHAGETSCIDGSLSHADRLYNVAVSGIEASTGLSLPYARVKDMVPLPEARSYFERWISWNNLIEFIVHNEARTPHKSCHYKQDEVHAWHKDGLVWISSSHGKHVLSYLQCLMIKDVLYSRFLIYMMLPIVRPEISSHLKDLISDHFNWQEACLIRYGNDGFSIMKYTEALGKSYMSIIVNDPIGETGSYYRMLDKVALKEAKLIPGVQPLCRLYDKILRRCHSVEEVAELFGLYRVSGHPLIDPTLGGKSAKSEGKRPDVTRISDSLKLRWTFCKLFLDGYLKRNGSWPHLVFPDNSGPSMLKTLSSMGFKGSLDGLYSLEDWSGVRFGKTFDFDYAPNYLELMDDKAISYYRSEVKAAWYDGIDMRSERRLLLELLKRPDIYPQDIVEKVMRRNVPDDWKVVCLTPKERELKPEARMFAMMPFEMRLFFILTEMNIAHSIFPYIPQQAMVKSKVELDTIFQELSQPSQSDAHQKAFVEIDLSRWNLRWRDQSVRQIAEVLDDLFGLPGVYTYAHVFFTEAQILVRVNDLPPCRQDDLVIPESDLAWTGHLGGFEGLCQKLWTIPTICIIYSVMNQKGMSYRHFGQGDNQILALVVPVTSDTRWDMTRQKIMEVAGDIEIEFSLHNQEAKFDECIESTVCITFSKNVYINGMDIHTILKFTSRILPSSSTDFPSVRANVGSIHSSCLMVAAHLSCPLRAYWISLFLTHLYLEILISRGQGIYGAQIKALLGPKKADFITLVSVLPSELGGYPISTPAHYFYRGASDPLSTAVAGIYAYQRSGLQSRLVDRIIRQVQNGYGLKAKPNKLDLLSDPYSIPLDTPALPSSVIMDDTLTALQDVVQNRDIRQLISAESAEYHDQLIEALGLITPFNPLIGRDILDCSSYGIKTTIKKMFVNTRSVQAVVRETNEDIVSSVLKAEMNLVNALLKRLTMLPRDPALRWSIYTTVTRLRSYWNRVFSQEIVGVTTYHPFDFQWKQGNYSESDQGIEVICQSSAIPPTAIGPYRAYFGSATLEKRSEHGYKIQGPDTISIAYRKLQLILSQCGGSDDFKQLINSVGLTRAPITLSTISSLLTNITGGTLSHRYATRVGTSGAYSLGTMVHLSHCISSTDKAGCLSGGAVDYPVMIQEFMLMGMSLTRYLDSSFGPRAILCMIGTQDLDPLGDITLTVPGLTLPTPISYRGNRLAYLETLDVRKITSWTGEVAYSSPFHPVAGWDDQLITRVFKAWTLQGMRGNQQGRALADIRTDIRFKQQSLDIMEIAGGGVKNLIRGVSQAITLEALDMFLSLSKRARNRWKLATVLYKLSRSTAMELAPLLSHPIIRRDPYIADLALYQPPEYSQSFDPVKERLMGIMVSHALDLITSPLHLRDLVVDLYPQDRMRQGSESVLLLIKAYLYSSVSSGLLSEDQAQDTSYSLLRAIRGVEDEETRIIIIMASIPGISNILTGVGDVVTSSMMTKLGLRQCIFTHSLSLEDELRGLRVRTVSQVRIDKHVVINTPDSWRKLFKRIHSFDRLVTSHPRSYQPEWTMSPIEISLWRVYRNMGRIPGAESISQYFWLPATMLLKGKTVLVIGSGYGSVAQCCLLNGVKHVYGLDLRCHMPMREHRYRSYVPPLVLRLKREEDYTQVKESFTTTGDWYDSSVSSAVLRRVRPEAVVLDLEDNTPSSLLKQVHMLVEAGWGGLVLQRSVQDLQSSHWILSDIQAMTGEVDIMCIDRRGNRLELISKSLLSPASAVLYGMSPMIDITTLMPQDFNTRLDQIPGTEYDIHVILTMGFLHPVLNDTTQNLYHQLIEIYQEMKGEYLSRLNYAMWSRLLDCIALYEILIHTNRLNVVREITHILTTGCYQYRNLLVKPSEIKITRLFVKYLTRYVPRLL